MQPVVEVFPEFAVFDQLLEVLVGGHDDPQVEGDVLGAADTLQNSFFEHSQQLRLQGNAKIGNFAQDQAAAVGFFDQTGFGPLGVREGAF